MQVTGAQALLRSLEHEGVEVVFGLPGGVVLPIYDAFVDSPIRHVLVRHEQGAGHMAEGYALATGRPGVALVTSGPGATNIVTAVADAYLDAIPLVVITGQVTSTALGSDAFQEADTTGITMPITKHNWLVTDAQDIPSVVHEAFHIAGTGRPGPVLIDFPKDVANQAMDWHLPDGIDLPGYTPVTSPHVVSAAEAARVLLAASQPLLCAGGEFTSDAAGPLGDLVALTGTHVVTTSAARGAIADVHPLVLAHTPDADGDAARAALQHADLVVALGTRLDDELIGLAPGATVIDVDLVHLLAAVRAIVDDEGAAADQREWHATIRGWKEKPPAHDAPAADGPLEPQAVITSLRDAAPGGTIIVSGVGAQEVVGRHWRYRQPASLISSRRFGTMGFAVPAAIGAKVGMPDATVWAVDSDACFQMTGKELVTASVERIPIKVAVLTEVHHSTGVPDHVRSAEAMGCVGLRARTPREAVAAIEAAGSIDDRPVVIDFRLDAPSFISHGHHATDRR